MARVLLGNIKGPKGDPGPAGPSGVAGSQGEPGYTPVKGVDYFTEEDISSIIAMGTSNNGSASGLAESTDNPGCYYRMVNGEKEWINPPMVVGVEYRTTDRFMGKVVYKQAVDFGSLPNTSEKIVQYSTPSGSITAAIKCWGYSNARHTLPYIYRADGILKGISVYASELGVAVSTSGNASEFSAVLIVEYLKN